MLLYIVECLGVLFRLGYRVDPLDGPSSGSGGSLCAIRLASASRLASSGVLPSSAIAVMARTAFPKPLARLALCRSVSSRRLDPGSNASRRSTSPSGSSPRRGDSPRALGFLARAGSSVAGFLTVGPPFP